MQMCLTKQTRNQHTGI